MVGKSKTFRKHKVGNYTVVDNKIFKDKTLSLKGKGLLLLMLSLPDSWEFSERGLTVLSKDGRDSVRSGLVELEEAKYLERKVFRDENGRFIRTQYNVYEEPRLNKPKLESPRLDNPPNKELSNKVLNESSTNEYKTLSSKEKEDDIPFEEIIGYLNKKAKKPRGFIVNEPRKGNIKARFKEGYKLEDFKYVVDVKTEEWLKDKKMSQYLTPETLFVVKNFDKYLNQPMNGKQSNQPATPIKYAESKEFTEEELKELNKELDY